MAGFPRKFSEKIALLNQKAAEGNANYYSIISQVKQIKPSNSGSQLDLNESLNDIDTFQLNSFIDETCSNEQINTTYISDQHRQHMLNHFENLQQHGNSEASKKHHLPPEARNNQFQQVHNSIINNNSFLQLPGQNDSFRRAHSDSSIPQSVTTHPDLSNCTQEQIQTQSHTDQAYNNNNQHFQQFHQYQPNSTHYTNNTRQAEEFPSNTNYLQPQILQQQQTQFATPNHPTDQKLENNINTTKSDKLDNINLNLINNNKKKSTQFNYSQSQVSSPVLPSTIQPFPYNNQSVNNFSPQMSSQHFQLPPMYQNQNQQQQQQQTQQSEEQLLSPNSINLYNNVSSNNNNFLCTNILYTGGSLPDLTSFHVQQNQLSPQIQDHNKNRSLAEQGHQFEQYKPNLQLLQPNFQQHNHIGPVKPTHDKSVSPTRSSSRYSPTNIGHSSIANRRPSPQHLGLNRQALLADQSSVQSSPSSPYVSSPNSPLIPSRDTLPSLEFTINSQQLSAMSQRTVNGLANKQSRCNSGSGSKQVYPSHSGGNFNANESLPPSPLSQNSCCSPQGSPEDPNFFNPSNSYDQLHKKFDLINLETSNQQQLYQTRMMPFNMIPPTQGSPHQQSNVQMTGPHSMNGLCSPTFTGTQSNHDILRNNFDSGVDTSTIENPSIKNSSDSLSSSSSVNNTFMDDENQSNFQSNNKQAYQLQTPQQIPDTKKQHKNSIPDIIFTFSSDCPEDKNDNKDLSTIYNENFLTKNEQFNYDLEMLSEPVPLDNQTSSSHNYDHVMSSVMSNQQLYQQT